MKRMTNKGRPSGKLGTSKQSGQDVAHNRPIQRYDDKNNATVAMGGNNNGQVVIHSGNEGNMTTEHKETLEQVGKISSLETEQDLIRTYVNGTLWKKKKFIAISKGELDWNSQICRCILMALKIPDKSEDNFWACNREFVRKCLVIKRNNVVSALKQNFFSKYMKY
jgi:hypothetical protein